MQPKSKNNIKQTKHRQVTGRCALGVPSCLHSKAEIAFRAHLNMHQLRESYTMFPSAEDVALRASIRKIKTTDQIGWICIFHLKLGNVEARWRRVCIACQPSYFSFPPRWHRCLSYQIWCNWQVFSCKEDICLPSPCQAEWRRTPAQPFTSD